MSKQILQMDYRGLRKVVSGGQCGADRGGLDGAREAGLETGGWAPLGWRVAGGTDPTLSELGLQEHHSPDYPPRTRLNVVESDATILIARNPDSAGSRLTIELCRKNRRPLFYTRPADIRVDKVVAWMLDNSVEVLNVAGNRDYDTPVHYEAARQLVVQVAAELAKAGKLQALH